MATVPEATPRVGIAGPGVILLAGFVASRTLGLVRDVLIGAAFGTSADYDLYVAAFRLPDALFALVAGGALGSALVPVLAEYKTGGPPEALPRLATTVFNLLAIVAGVAAAGGVLLAPRLVPLFGGFSPEEQARLVPLIRLMLLQPVFFGMGEVLARYLNVQRHFLSPACAPAVYNLAIIAATVTLTPLLGVGGLAAGVTLGALLAFLVQVPQAVRLGFTWRPLVDRHEPGLRRILRLMVPRVIGQGAIQLSALATTRLATFLPYGRLAALNYGLQLMMLPLGAFAMALANAAFPTLAEQAAQRDLRAVSQTVRRTMSAILFFLVPSALGLVAAGLPLTQALLQRDAFTAESTRLTATAVAYYALGLPAHGLYEILARAFYALQEARLPAAVGVFAAVTNVVLAYVLVGPLGHGGIALAFSLSTVIGATVLALALRRRLPDLFGGDFASSLARTALAGAALLGATAPVVVATRAGGLPAPVQALAAVTAGGLAYLVAARLLRSPELEAALDRLGTLRRTVIRKMRSVSR